MYEYLSKVVLIFFQVEKVKVQTSLLPISTKIPTLEIYLLQVNFHKYHNKPTVSGISMAQKLLVHLEIEHVKRKSNWNISWKLYLFFVRFSPHRQKSNE